MPTEFVDGSPVGSRGDMLRRVRFRRRDGRMAVPAGAARAPVDRHMAVRIAAFIGRIHPGLVRNGRTGPRGGLPPVLPIVPYNGSPSRTAVPGKVP